MSVLHKFTKSIVTNRDSFRSLMVIIILIMAAGLGSIFPLLGDKFLILFVVLIGALFIILCFGFLPILLVIVPLLTFQIGLNYMLLNIVFKNSSLWEVSLFLCFVLFILFMRLRIPRMTHYMPPYSLLPIGFLFWAVIALMISPGEKDFQNFSYLRSIPLYALVIYVLFTNVIHKPKEAVLLLALLVLGGTAFGIFVSFNINGIWDPILRVSNTRAIGYAAIDALGRGGVTLAEYLALLIPIALAIGLFSRRRWVSLFFLGDAILLSILVALTESRVASISVAVVILCFIFLGLRQHRNRIRQVFLVGVLSTIIFLIIIVLRGLNASLLQRLLEGNFELGFRSYLWRYAWNLLMSNPFGTGFDFMENLIGFRAHNDYLFLALGSGFLGMLCFEVFLLVIAWKIYKGFLNSSNNSERLVYSAAFGCCIVFIINSLTSHISGNIYVWPSFWIILSTAIGLARSRSQRKNSGFRTSELV